MFNLIRNWKKLFPSVVVTFYSPTCDVWAFQLLDSTGCLYFIVLLYYGFSLHFPDEEWYCAALHAFIDDFSIFFYVYSSVLPFFNLILTFYWFVYIFMYSEWSSLSDICCANIFSQHSLTYWFYWCYLWMGRNFKLWWNLSFQSIFLCVLCSIFSLSDWDDFSCFLAFL